MGALYTARPPLVVASLADTAVSGATTGVLLSVGPLNGRVFSAEATVEVVSGPTTALLALQWTTPRGTVASFTWYSGLAALSVGVHEQLPVPMEAIASSAAPIQLLALAATPGQVYPAVAIRRLR